MLHTWYLPYKAKKAVFYAILFWIVGFVWGSVVFIVPSLKNLSSVPYLSKYPAISFPLLIAYVILLFVLVPRYLKTTEHKKVEGLKFGATLSLINFLLDFFIYYALLNGADYFTYFSVWLTYILFIVVPQVVADDSKI